MGRARYEGVHLRHWAKSISDRGVAYLEGGVRRGGVVVGLRMNGEGADEGGM